MARRRTEDWFSLRSLFLSDIICRLKFKLTQVYLMKRFHGIDSDNFNVTQKNQYNRRIHPKWHAVSLVAGYHLIK